ncbi:hypothetical protein C8R47DRAFT_1216472 [Mycena vitilis]|nr:hypothetical protein C8R47DRAFT_1216472 [Mycena vitilis]
MSPAQALPTEPCTNNPSSLPQWQQYSPPLPKGRRTRSGAEFSPFVFLTPSKSTPRPFDAVRVAFLDGLRSQYTIARALPQACLRPFLTDAVYCYIHHFGWDEAGDGNMDDRHKYIEELYENIHAWFQHADAIAQK